jgi:type IV pilus assembly protein PilQ
MKKTVSAILAFLIIIFSTPGIAQNYLQKTLTGQYSPDQLVTFASSIPFNDAIALINKVSEKTTGIKVVSTVDRTDPVGVEINGLYYEKALDIIVKYAGLIYERQNDMIVVKNSNAPPEVKKDASTYAPVDARDVKISAIFFDSDVLKARQMGINWQVLLSRNGLNLGGQLGDVTDADPLTGGSSSTSSSSSTSTQKFTGGQLAAKSSFNLGDFSGNATALFQFLESENVGEVITAPNTTVRDGQEGTIQVGSDFSVKTKDFAGNTIEKFYPTGTILKVTPHVYSEKGINYIILNINAERSTFQVSDLTSVINKTAASTQVIMLNGEETVIGGLFINDEKTERTGVPFLKDLPWWVFGLRYIFGSDNITVEKRELVILIKAELIPTLEERLAGPQATNPLRDEILKNREKIKYYKFNGTTNNDNN